MTSGFSYEIDLCWSIMLPKIVETIIKEIFWVSIEINFLVEMTIDVSSVITHPHIITCLCKSESQ